jgi:hypothetical protein
VDVAKGSIRLDPFQFSTMIHLATAYEKQKEYVKAFDWFEKALSLLLPSERQPHNDTYDRLCKLSDEQKSRSDPFFKLPLSVMVNSFQFALTEDRHVVLRSTWVNRLWRRVLLNQCPQLWGTLTLPWSELKDTFFREKHEAWIARSRGKFHTINLEHITISGVIKVPKAYCEYMHDAKNLRMTSANNQAFWRLCHRLTQQFQRVEHLYFDGGDLGDGHDRADWPTNINVMHGEVVKYARSRGIKTMEIRNVDFRESRLDGLHDADRKTVDLYSGLESLTVSGC